MLKILTYNWPAKLLCLFLAMGLWTYVAIGESQVENLPGKIPLETKNVGADLVAITDIETVQIKVSADRSTWQKLSANSFEAYVDLNGLAQGTHEVEVSVKANVPGVEIIEVVPDKVLVRLEPLTKKKVSVKLQTEGEAGEGLVPGEAIIDPEEVEISGAQSVIEKILEATATIQLSGETNQIEKTVPLLALDAQSEKIKNISFSPSEVKVTLPIVKAGTTKTVGIKTKLIGKVKTGYWISQINLNPSDVTIRGNSGVLRGIEYIESKNIDIEGVSADFSQTVDLDLPSGVSLVGATGRVRVEIKISAVGSEKEIIAGLIYNNLASNLKVNSVDPAVVKVIVAGPTDILNNLSSDNVRINFDLSSYNSAGSYSIDINKNMISVPSGATVSSFAPSAVRINLANK